MAELKDLMYPIRSEFTRQYSDWYARRDARPTLEIVGASFVASQETIFGLPNQTYIDAEHDWYLSQSLSVDDIPGGAPKIWAEVSSHDGLINSNYGYLLLSEENYKQLDAVEAELRRDAGSRRAVAIYTRPTMHTDWNFDGMSDFVCTNAVHYELRDDELHVVVQMRSNDAVFGYKNDFPWQRYVQETLVETLQDQYPGLRAGIITWQVASLHVYRRHFYLVHHYSRTGQISITRNEFLQAYPEESEWY